MPYIQLNDSQFPLFVGETHVGRGVGADILIPGSEGDETALIAVVTLGDDHSATIAGANDQFPVSVNGIALGKEPSPLQHGDRIELAGLLLRFADEVQGMVTHPMPSISSAAASWARSGEPALTGGRLISLMDGRDYLIGTGSITIGRDAGCDIVVAVTEVSRRHARVESTPEGYYLVDTSTNGVLLNGERIMGTAALGRGDTIRVGPEEFRFHADATPVAPPPPPPIIVPPPPRIASPNTAKRVDADAGPTSASSQPRGTAAAGSRRPVLATLEVMNEGPTKGDRFEITTTLAHVGRGTHNDIPIADDSVSDLHAKLQLRDNGWYVVDMGSTNGTYVGGERVTGEAQLLGNADVRFGGIKFAFRSMSGGKEAPHGTRVIVGLKAGDPARGADSARAAARPKAPFSSGPERIGIPRPLLIALVLLAFVIVFLIMQGA
ncbi:MAG: FHA domain-containing protein [Gemmatimonadaceae bacterium]